MQKNQGYITLITVLIIAAVALAISTNISLLGIGVAQSSLADQLGQNALEFSEGCAEDGLLNAQKSNTYTGGTVARPEGTCVITVQKNGNNWTIIANGTQSAYNRTVQVQFTRISGSPITISSWQESTPYLTPTPTPTPIATPAPPQTPVLDTQSYFNQPNNKHSISWSHTVGSNSNNLLIVDANSCDPLNSIASVTYGSQSLTRYTSIDNGLSATDEEMWYLVNPNSGTNTITVTLSGSDSTCIDGQGISFSNVNQSIPLGTAATTDTTSNTHSISNTATSTVNQLVLDSIWSGNGTSDGYTPGSGQTELISNPAYGAASTKLSTGSSTTISWTLNTGDNSEDIAVGINPYIAPSPTPTPTPTITPTPTPIPPAVTFMESGTDATHNFDFYSSTYAGISSNCTIAETGSCSIEAKNSPANTNNLVNTPPGSLNGTAARISFYVYFTNLNGGSNLIELYDGGTYVGDVLGAYPNSSGFLLCGAPNAGSGNCAQGIVIPVDTWTRISMAYSITSANVNKFSYYVNGVHDFTITNAALSATNPDEMRLGIIGNDSLAGDIDYFDDIYVDAGTDLSDPGNIHVTAKRPFANGLTNAWGTRLGSGSSGYGSGHAPEENEQPLNTTDGWSTTSNSTQEYYTIESASTGEENISNNTLIAGQAWLYIKGSSCSGDPEILNNGVLTGFIMPTSPTMITNYESFSGYPSSNEAVGVVGCSANSSPSYLLYEAGMQIAYK